MIRFDSDYMAGAHPEVLDALVRTNLELTPGYGNDAYTAEARDLIRKATGCPEAEVRFLVGGTQTNATIIDGLLSRHEGVLAAESGHIAVHESGAIEASGHKVLTLPHHDGKVRAEDVEEYITTFYADQTYEHMVAPGMLYISHPTEYGTIYSRDELQTLSDTCHRHNIPLYIDGARLGYGLAAEGTDVTLRDIARLADVFYIGGTKIGALCGEAVVFKAGKTPERFYSMTKQHGAMMAKGRVLGVQFEALFEDGLYFDISKNAIDRAEELKELFVRKGYQLFTNSPTNQQFIVLTNDQMERIKPKCNFAFWERLDAERCVVRFATSYATTVEDIALLESLI